MIKIPDTYWQLSEQIRETLAWLNRNKSGTLEWRQKYNEWKSLVNKQNHLIDQLEGRFNVAE